MIQMTGRYPCISDIMLRRADGGVLLDVTRLAYNVTISAVEVDVIQSETIDRDVVATLGPSPLLLEFADSGHLIARIHFEKATPTLPGFDTADGSAVIVETVILRGVRVERASR